MAKEKKEKKDKKEKKEEKVKKEKKEKKDKKKEKEVIAVPPKKEKKEKKDKKDKKEKKNKKEKRSRESSPPSDKRTKRNDWSKADLGDTKSNEKFQKLIGAKKEAAQQDSTSFFAGSKVETDPTGALMVRKGKFQIFLPAKLQNLKPVIPNSLDKATADKINNDLEKQDKEARLSKKKRGLGLGFSNKPVDDTPQCLTHSGEGKHTTFDNDDSSSSSSSSSSS